MKAHKTQISKNVYTSLADFRYQLKKFLHFSDSEARKFGISPQQHQLLLAIKGYPGRDFATPGELSERLFITHHGCVGLIDRCEQLGFVSRKRNPDDGRSVLVEVTEKGGELLEKLSQNHLAELSRIGLMKDV